LNYFGNIKILTLFLLLVPTLVFGQLESQMPDDPCVKGRNLYESARFKEARNAFLRCVAIGDPDLETLLPLTVMGIQEARLDEAAKYGKMAILEFPDNADARYWYGRALLRLERVEEARKQWETGLQISIEHQGILEGLARLALNEGEPSKAYQLLDQMRRQGLDDAWLHRLLADIAASRGLWAQSLVHLKDAMSREAPNLSDYLAASELSLMTGDKEAAVGYCRVAVHQEPCGASYGALGEAFFASDSMDSALVYLRLAVDSESDNPRHRFNLANALEITGQFEAAEKHFQYFLASQPDDVVGNFNYGIHLEKQGRDVEALYYINRTISLEPGMLSALIIKVQLLEKMQMFDEALGELALLKQADPASLENLNVWENRLLIARSEAMGARVEGKIHLLHMILSDRTLVDQVLVYLDGGADFGSLVTQYSTGPAAARGGDIGWIKPEEMVEELREAIEALGSYDISPPIESRGLYHIFKRLP